MYQAWSDPLDPRYRMDKQVNDIVAKIHGLERNRNYLEALCGEILAALRRSLDHDHLTVSPLRKRHRLACERLDRGLRGLPFGHPPSFAFLARAAFWASVLALPPSLPKATACGFLRFFTFSALESHALNWAQFPIRARSLAAPDPGP
jgi:hypothetical protein